MNERIKKAIDEGRLRFFSNGKYSYKPSSEYTSKFVNKEAEVKGESLSSVIKNSIKKLDALDRAFGIAETRNKKVSHVSNNKIILI
jgi:hypothetical protein